jgi:signal transduction histidine kinase
LVADHGIGIPKDFQDRVFDAFAQAEQSAARSRGGVGLGLAICKSIVEAHGGSIAFTSKEGQGTTFYFDLPLSLE